MFVMMFGIFLAGFGILFITVFVFSNWRKSDNPIEATLLPALLLLVLIGLNFAAADVILHAVAWIEVNHPTQQQIDSRTDTG